MIKMKVKTYTTFLYKVQQKVIEENKTKLASWTTKMTAVDLLAVFQLSKSIDVNRSFWTNETGDFSFVSIGKVKQLRAENDGLRNLQTAWEDMVSKAHIYNPYGVSGTGIVAVGGMDFDPLKAATKLWQSYPTNQLTIPTYLIVKNADDYYLTVNQFITGETDIAALEDSVFKVEKLMQETSGWKPARRQTVIEKVEIEKANWKAAVEKAVMAIQTGYAEKIVLAREMRLTLNRKAQITAILNNLINSQQHSYIFAFAHGDDCFIGASPERLIKVEGDQLLSTCLAGTAPRGGTVAEDEEIALKLLNDQKNLEEHDYVVKMIKQNIAAACQKIDMPAAPVIFPLRNLQHLYTPISATLKADYTIFDMIQKLHPTPALGGVPTRESLEFIREEEALDRGWYGAPIGWLDSNDNGEFAVAIRSGLIQGESASLFAGCGVMRDSDAEMEYEETNVKFLPMLHALEVD